MPRVSVVMPAFNVERYIQTAMASVLAQTEQDIELLVVDDGATDGTAALIDDWSQRDPRVRAFHGPNRGVSHARNVAMAHATGGFFAFLDADDEWAPTFLARQLAVLEGYPDVAIVTGNAVNRGGRVDGRPVRAWPDTPRRLTFVEMIDHENIFFIMSVFRREVYDSVGGFDEGLRHSEDYEFWMRAAAHGFGVMANPTPLGWYRRHEASASANEIAMLEGAGIVYSRIRAGRGPFSGRAGEGKPCAVKGALDRQINRIETQLLSARGTQALLDGRFDEARAVLAALWRRRPRFRLALLLLGLRLAPWLVLWGWRLRRGCFRWRPGRTAHA